MLKQLVDAICFRLINGPLGGASSPEFAISKMTLSPGDVIVLRYAKQLPSAVVDRLRKNISDALDGHKCIVLENGLDIGVLSGHIEFGSDPASVRYGRVVEDADGGIAA